MADEVLDPQAATTPAGTPDGPGSSAVLDPARYAELERYYEQTGPIIERLRPYEEDVKALLEGGEEYVKFSRSSRESYYDMQKRLEAEREAEVPESERRLLNALDERLGKFKPVLDDYESRAQAQERTAKEASQDFAKRESEYASRLVAEQKLSPTEVQDLAEYAMTLHQKSVKEGNPRFVGIEEVYKRVYGRAEVQTAKPVAKSLRSTAGATGVPGASKAPERPADLAKPGNLTRHMLGVLNSQRKTG
jgi:hypothetical protein